MREINKNNLVEENENPFSEVFYKYLPYWPLFIALLVVSCIGGFLYLRYAVPDYDISASILVKDEKKGVDDSNLMEQLDLFGSKKLVENEIEVIQSRTLLQAVAKNLSLYAPVVEEGRIGSRSAYVISPVRIQVKDPDRIKTTKRIYFEYDSANQLVVSNNKKYQLDTWYPDQQNEIRFIANPVYQRPDKIKPLYYTLKSIKKVTSDLSANLKVKQATKLSSVIDLNIKDPVPLEGEDILNSLMQVYDSAAIKDKNGLASNTLKFINRRLLLVSTDLDSVENGIQKYKTSEGIVDISAQGQLYLDNVGANDQKLSEIDVQIAALDEIEKYVKNKNSESGMVPAIAGIDNPVLSQLLSKLYDLEVEYEGMRKTTAENNPLAIAVYNEIQKIRPSVLENINNQRRNLAASRLNLSSTSNRYSSILKTLPKKESRLVEISRQQLIMNNLYSYLLQKKEETALSYYSTIADSRIVDKAESTIKPVSPKPLVVWLGALLLALGAGVSVIAIKEIFNRYIIFRKEIEQFTSVPVIGEIIYNTDAAKPLVIEEGKRTYIAEQFRSIRTSLAYLGINSRKKKILITSTISGEGKSFITSNLGISLALMNKKVILLELDLRKPKLSKAFNISREIGITNYLIGNKEADEVIKRSGVNDNLFIIPSGAIPPNPSELILNGRLEELLAYLETTFDYILMDTSPVSPVTDAYILSPFCDATLYVIRHGVTPKQYIKHLDENLKVRGLKNLAIIFNGVKSRGLTKYDYGYGYGKSGGNYGYAEEEQKKESKIFGFLKKSRV
jgi:capsular exopolysaccharide synthesis family protein